MKSTINVAKDFNRCPAGRYYDDGPWPGEKFLNDLLRPALEKFDQITIELDGTAGYGGSFLEESFGSIAIDLGIEEARRRLHFISNDDPGLIEIIHRYMDRAAKSGKPSH